LRPQVEIVDKCDYSPFIQAYQKLYNGIIRVGDDESKARFLDDVLAIRATVRKMLTRRNQAGGKDSKIRPAHFHRQAAASQRFNEEAEFSQCGHQVLAMESNEFGFDLDYNAELSPDRVELYMRARRDEFENSEAQQCFCKLDLEAGLPPWQVAKRMRNRLPKQLPLLLLCMLLLPLLWLQRLLLLLMLLLRLLLLLR